MYVNKRITKTKTTTTNADDLLKNPKRHIYIYLHRLNLVDVYLHDFCSTKKNNNSTKQQQITIYFEAVHILIPKNTAHTHTHKPNQHTMNVEICHSYTNIVCINLNCLACARTESEFCGVNEKDSGR